MANGKADFNSQKIEFKPRYWLMLKVSTEHVSESEIRNKLNESKITAFELEIVKDVTACMLQFQSKDDVKSAMKALKSLTKDITDGYDAKVFGKILEEVRKNPPDQDKKVKTSLPFMHLGADSAQV